MKILPFIWSACFAKFTIPDFEFRENAVFDDAEIGTDEYIYEFGKRIKDDNPRVARNGFVC